jgi:hypothetical protein
MACVYNQFVFGKLLGKTQAAFEIVAATPGLDTARANYLHKAFGQFYPSMGQIPSFENRFVLKVDPNEVVMAHFYRSSDREPGRNYYILTQYQILGGVSPADLWQYIYILARQIAAIQPSEYVDLEFDPTLFKDSDAIWAGNFDLRGFNDVGKRFASLFESSQCYVTRVAIGPDYDVADMLRAASLLLCLLPRERGPIWFALAEAIPAGTAFKQRGMIFERTTRSERSGIPQAPPVLERAYLSVVACAIENSPSVLPEILSMNGSYNSVLEKCLSLSVANVSAEGLTREFCTLWKHAAENKNWFLAASLARPLLIVNNIHLQLSPVLMASVFIESFDLHKDFVRRFLECCVDDFSEGRDRVALFFAELRRHDSVLWSNLRDICFTLPANNTAALVFVLFEFFKTIPSTTFKDFHNHISLCFGRTYWSALVSLYGECDALGELLSWCEESSDVLQICEDSDGHCSKTASAILIGLAKDSLHHDSQHSALLELIGGASKPSSFFEKVVRTALHLRVRSIVRLLTDPVTRSKTDLLPKGEMHKFVDFLRLDRSLVPEEGSFNGTLVGICAAFFAEYGFLPSAVNLTLRAINSDGANVPALRDAFESMIRVASPALSRHIIFSTCGSLRSSNGSIVRLATLSRALYIAWREAYYFFIESFIYSVGPQRSLQNVLEIAVAGAAEGLNSSKIASELAALRIGRSFLVDELQATVKKSASDDVFCWDEKQVRDSLLCSGAWQSTRLFWIAIVNEAVALMTNIQKHGRPNVQHSKDKLPWYAIFRLDRWFKKQN